MNAGMILDVAMAAVPLALEIVTFRHFEQRTPLWRRFLKIFGVLAMTAVISHTSAGPVSLLRSVSPSCP